MRRFLPCLGAATAVLAMTCSVKATAQEKFKDVPMDHWAYQAVTDLQKQKVLAGYPDGFFNGRRTLPRDEFAVALKRVLENIQGGQGLVGAPGKDGAQGATGAQGVPGYMKGYSGASRPTPRQLECEPLRPSSSSRSGRGSSWQRRPS